MPLAEACHVQGVLMGRLADADALRGGSTTAMALRDINDLLARGILHKSDAGGRSTSYELGPLSD